MSDYIIAALCHFSLLIFFIHSFIITIHLYPLQKNGFLWLRGVISWLLPCIPPIILLAYRNYSLFIADQAQQACNFEINIFLMGFIMAFSALFITLLLEKYNHQTYKSLVASYGKMAFILINLYGVFMTAYGSYNAAQGINFRYPFTINFMK